MSDQIDTSKDRKEEFARVGTRNHQWREPGGQEQMDNHVQRVAGNKELPAYAEAVPSSAEGPSGGNGRHSLYHCPVCDGVLPHLAAPPPRGSTCCECRFRLWCRRLDSTVGVVLEALPGPAPESWEVTTVVDSLDKVVCTAL